MILLLPMNICKTRRLQNLQFATAIPAGFCGPDTAIFDPGANRPFTELKERRGFMQIKYNIIDIKITHNCPLTASGRPRQKPDD
ncbi:hypothetical protein FCN80_22110 [Martelella alba]|uniref:Uncharacterized protein n=1 Tax=Martelella alba TaxID=2590451 RepID=A0ABY2SGT6_9HYPH|nr:hypothetical protein FCN80_22110 [Martelella alba]